ncbi:hypothetical protein PtA15_11A565 [Puccinia triticina]|uniref:Tet-like 2OG-Fe(II) oxygenase domain-containing protein n=1 Tax=Puccinia triticina TaxID=208348 RepID=A0ABY7CX47_9BASI|nr:uncharacterized protein PtA15_11A565 [Puccinia triticina]WAQ89873.1 hypothetical protein PtA15_11A565 [Puccinia triticina]
MINPKLPMTTEPSSPTYAAVLVSGNPTRTTISHPNTAANQSLRKPAAKDVTPAQTSDLSSAQSTPSLMPAKPMGTPAIISAGQKKGCHPDPPPGSGSRLDYSAVVKGGKQNKCHPSHLASAAPPPGSQIITRKMRPIDLFPAVTKDFRQRFAEYKLLMDEYKADPENNPKPPQVFARNPTKEENKSALEIVEKTLYTIDSNYNKIYDEGDNQMVALVEFIPLSDLSPSEWDDYDFLCLFLHQCKEFISPVASKSQKCQGIMWALGWRKGYDGLEILGIYRHQAAINKNPDGFRNLMQEGSARDGQILWKTFHSFGDVAVEKNQAYMKRFNIPSIADNNFPENPEDKSPFGFASNLAFSLHGFYNHHHTDDEDLSDLPLAFALIIPTSRITVRIATAAQGYDVENGQFIFRDIQLALKFKPDYICMSAQVATKTSNACKNYLNGIYDDDTDKYFGGLEDLLSS